MLSAQYFPKNFGDRRLACASALGRSGSTSAASPGVRLAMTMAAHAGLGSCASFFGCETTADLQLAQRLSFYSGFPLCELLPYTDLYFFYPYALDRLHSLPSPIVANFVTG